MVGASPLPASPKGEGRFTGHSSRTSENALEACWAHGSGACPRGGRREEKCSKWARVTNVPRCSEKCSAVRWRLQCGALAIAVRCVGDCSALRWQMQCGALADAVRCVGGCSAVRWRLQRGALADAVRCVGRCSAVRLCPLPLGGGWEGASLAGRGLPSLPSINKTSGTPGGCHS